MHPFYQLSCRERNNYSFYPFCLLPTPTGLDKIEFLQSHDNPEIYRKSFEIIEEYFSQDDDESTQLVPNVEGQEFQFGVEENAENLQF